MASQENPVISLTVQEQSLFALLRSAAACAGKPVVCRVAGGWVRDKIVGAAGSKPDLDVVLDTMTGHSFALLLKEYLLNHTSRETRHLQQNEHNFETFEKEGGEATSSCAFPVKRDSASVIQLEPKMRRHEAVSRIAVIKANPEKSKHLETATCTILGFDLDFVNLRSEDYTDGSRIPTKVKFGTPLEDAVRRDFTVNSLFYNIETNQVEDYTSKGLNDIKSRTIRTPLDPDITLRDDPLRLLRALRFAAQLNYSICPNLWNSIKTDTLLCSKVSRERIGIEIQKMLSLSDSRKVAHAFRLLDDSNVLQKITFTSTSASPNVPCGSLRKAPVISTTEYFACEEVKSAKALEKPGHFAGRALETLNVPWVTLRLCLGCKLALLFFGMKDTQVAHMVKEHLRLSSKQADFTAAALRAIYAIQKFIESGIPETNVLLMFRVFKKITDKQHVTCSLAETLVLVAFALEKKNAETGKDSTNVRMILEAAESKDFSILENKVDDKELAALSGRYARLLASYRTLFPDVSAGEFKCKNVTGKEVIQVLNLQKSGRSVAYWIDAAREFEFLYKNRNILAAAPCSDNAATPSLDKNAEAEAEAAATLEFLRAQMTKKPSEKEKQEVICPDCCVGTKLAQFLAFDKTQSTSCDSFAASAAAVLEETLEATRLYHAHFPAQRPK